MTELITRLARVAVDRLAPWRQTGWATRAALVALTVVAGCASPPPPFHGPSLRGDVSHFPGSPLSGPSAVDLQSARPDTSLRVELSLVALAKDPGDALTPLASAMRLITVSRGGTPIVPTYQLAAGSRIGYQEAVTSFRETMASGTFGATEPVGTQRAVAPAGTTVSFRWIEEPSGSARGADDQRGLAIQVYRRANPETDREPGNASPSDGTLDIVLTLEGLVFPDAGDDPADHVDSAETEQAEEKRPSPVYQREVIVLDARSPSDGEQMVLLVPSPFRSSPARALAVFLAVKPPAADALQKELFAHSLKDLNRAAEEAAERSGMAPVGKAILPGLADALEQVAAPISYPLKRRRALVYLTGTAKAPLASDFVLSASDDLVKQFGDTIVGARARQDGALASTAAMAWTLERTAYKLLVAGKSKGDVVPELEAILAHHAGEVGRHAAVLDEVVTAAASVESLEARLASENLIYLEDISPAARTRAFDWLAARGLAPVGFDPLATLKERRTALARMHENLDKDRPSKGGVQ